MKYNLPERVLRDISLFAKKYSVAKILVMSMIIALIYAISDEVHQIFVPERGPGVKDVLIDFLGSMSAFLSFMLVRYVVLRFNRKKQGSVYSKMKFSPVKRGLFYGCKKNNLQQIF